MLSDPIEAFYPRHPYPPPVANLDRVRDEWQDTNRDRAEYHLFWPDRTYRTDLDILVAGCGTWQAARYALCRPAARIVGIDVSATSIEHTERLKQKYSLANLETRQLRVEQIGELQQRFDLIVCTGVLHHLADPDAGMRALRSVMKPDGAMHLMVYAPYGRIGARLIQEYCRTIGIGTSADEIHDLVATLEALPQQHPLVPLLRGSRDARNEDALTDVLLNPRERSYSVRQVLDTLDRNGLSFRRWYRQAPYLPQCGAIGSTPHAARLAALPEHEQYVAMELWRGTMTSHSVVVHRDDANVARIGFDSDRAMASVPLRLPWTLVVQDGVPAGATAALLNRSHPYRDLVLMLDVREKRLLDRIDGYRSIAEIAVRTDEPERSRALRFFEKLWWYDQVVFDASRAG